MPCAHSRKPAKLRVTAARKEKKMMVHTACEKITRQILPLELSVRIEMCLNVAG